VYILFTDTGKGKIIFFIVSVLDFQNAYVEYKEIQAAQGVKIAGKDLEKAVAGEIVVFKNAKGDLLKF
jgi:translation initiation factor IF-2